MVSRNYRAPVYSRTEVKSASFQVQMDENHVQPLSWTILDWLECLPYAPLCNKPGALLLVTMMVPLAFTQKPNVER